ncbi:phage tail protein [Nitrospirillum iridis]|uniref:Phage tail-like protein n=1 Tax=Nitrospirillum iridis TaxID=765888 RepID=A0A7X0B003_9PROT|nr:phage tail protein [Nitrospirillum iridis]MBB6253160.1 phage tail-like protein [Nitrospirillum iridis]
MKVTGFAARADIVGRRIRVTWQFVPGMGETLADIPPVTLRRKRRDYAYPAPGAPDPYLVYDSTGFPPPPVAGVLTVTDLDGWEEIGDGERRVFEPLSVAIFTGGRYIEILRRTTATVFDLGGVARRQEVEILDAGASPGALLANQVYYYQLFSASLPDGGADATPYRSAAQVTDSYGQNRALYLSLPEIYRRHDVQVRPDTPGSTSVPELSPNFGQLRRFIDPFGIALDSLRGTAEGLRTLHDVDAVDGKYLPTLAQWIGWDLSVDVDIPQQRNEIKAASRLYRLVGTLPGLRALVTQYTGWSTQVAEFAQNIAQSNQPPRRNLYAITPDAGGLGWHGTDDAAQALGFPAANQAASGSVGTAAALTSLQAGPYALRPGMSLTLAADGLPPVSVRFGPGDFIDMSQATAAEVGAALSAALPEVRATAAAATLVIASKTTGSVSRLQVVPANNSLVSLENAPEGRLSAGTDSIGRVRFFYGTWETPTRPASAVAVDEAAAEAGGAAMRRVHYKTFTDGAWRGSRPVYPSRVTPQADPAAAVLPDDRIWLAWIDDPLTMNSRLRWTLGTARPPQPAHISGRVSEPFALVDGATLAFTGNWPGLDLYTVHAANFANPAKATAAELVTAMNGQLTRVRAARERDGSLRFSTIASGATTRIGVDLSHSRGAARALGFDNRGTTGTPGSWDDQIDWNTPWDAGGRGRHAEVTAVNNPAGGVRLAWASHRAGAWRILTAYWNDRVMAGTANGAFSRDGAGAWTPVPGLPAADIRAIMVDAAGSAWIATAAGVAVRHPDGTVTTVAGLPSPDIRDLALAGDGSAWIATAAGLVLLAPQGTITTLDIGGGLPSNDIRALALNGDGTLWAATAAGAVRRRASGALQIHTVATGLPGNDVQDVALGADGAVYIATTAGLAVVAPEGAVTVAKATNTRAVAIGGDGTLWVATPAGVSLRSPAGAWRVFDTTMGLNSDDARALSLGPDGTAWVGTAVGTSTITPDGTVTNLDLLGGGVPNPAGRAAYTGWSAALELANGGGGNREPALAVDATKRIWLFWSQRVGIGTEQESWGLHHRIFDPPTSTWGPDRVVTTPPLGGRSSDRAPGIQPLPAGMRVFFSSDRGGGLSLWSVDVGLNGVIGPLTPLPAGASSDGAPTPVTVGTDLWLFHRSDANVPLVQAGTGDAGRPGSQRVPDNGTERRYGGTVAADLGDLNRLRTRRSFGDMLSYTPSRPDGAGTLRDDELYTRGTVGFYVRRASQGAALTRQETERLSEMVRRFLPINLRAVVIIVEATDVEYLYPDGGPTESYADDFPFVSLMPPITDSTAAAMPGLLILESNKTDDVSADTADLTTLTRRTFFPPLQ